MNNIDSILNDIENNGYYIDSSISIDKIKKLKQEIRTIENKIKSNRIEKQKRKPNKINEINYNSIGSKMIISYQYKEKDKCDNLYVDVYFPEYNWTFKHIAYNNFRTGKIKCPYEPRVCGIGYIGEGNYNSDNKPESYKHWQHMLRRCYDSKYKFTYPTYENVTVCNEWHNFQNFTKWFDENYYEIPECRMELDKDILYKGNNIYSPDTCVFAPQRINTLFVKCDKNRGSLPIGVSYRKDKDKYMSKCRYNGKRVTLGYYDTPVEAFYAYKYFKECVIKYTADTYINYIPTKLYNALYNYEVEITD